MWQDKTIQIAMDVGGLVGYLYWESKIDKSYSQADVLAYKYGGGLVGGSSYNSKITDCYTKGDVTRYSASTENTFAAFIGYNYKTTIENCYTIGNVIYDGTTNPTDKGFAGYDYSGSYYNTFFDSQVSNQSTAIGATAKTTAEMQDFATYTDKSTTGLSFAWNFIGTPKR